MSKQMVFWKMMIIIIIGFTTIISISKDQKRANQNFARKKEENSTWICHYVFCCPMFCKVISHQQTICWVFSAKFAKYELLLNFELKSNSVNCHLTDSCFVTEDITEELTYKIFMSLCLDYSPRMYCVCIISNAFKVKVYQQEFDCYD